MQTRRVPMACHPGGSDRFSVNGSLLSFERRFAGSRSRIDREVDMADFAVGLNKLFETVHPPGRKPHTNAGVAAALTESGHSISKPYLSQLRSGQRTNPSDETVAALATFFKVEAGLLLQRHLRREDRSRPGVALATTGLRAAPAVQPRLRPVRGVPEPAYLDGREAARQRGPARSSARRHELGATPGICHGRASRVRTQPVVRMRKHDDPATRRHSLRGCHPT